MCVCQEDLLNQTLRFDAGPELQLWNKPARDSEVSVKVKTEESMEEGVNERGRGGGGDGCVKRRAWRQEAPQTLLNALADMEVSSLCSIASQPGEQNLTDTRSYRLKGEFHRLSTERNLQTLISLQWW